MSHPEDAPLARFLPETRAWFERELGHPTEPQARAWPSIAAGRNVLVSAPTGSGKTLTAFLWALDRLWREIREGKTFDAVDVLYVSPLKALNVDIGRNLERPLREVRDIDPSLAPLSVGIRSGDTPSAERQRMVRRPPHILITTPESLYLLLTSKRARPGLSRVRTVVVDELHSVAATKRGVHLALSLERLAELVGDSGGADPQRIGLSATVEPLETAARLLAGTHREVETIDTGRRRSMHLRVMDVPVASSPSGSGGDPARDGDEAGVSDVPSVADAPTVWDVVTDRLLADIRSHASTLVFVNNRRTAEQVVGRLNERVGARWADVDEPDAQTAFAAAHHGSVAHEVRAHLEEALKAGRLPCLVATGTLELGIDMGAVDLVCQIESPHSVSRGLQRVGRSGHLVDATSVGHIYPIHRVDLVEAAAVAREMRGGRIEAIQPPRNCLDVLAQQIVAEVSARDWDVDDLFAAFRKAYPYRDLPRSAFDAVVSMLCGDTKDPDLVAGKPRLAWDRESRELRTRPGSSQVAVQSGGTIPDRGLYPVYLAGSDVRLGELDEEFVFESKRGDVFALGSSLWRILEIGRDRVVVGEAPGAVPRMPFWRGEGLGRPWTLGVAVGRLLGDIGRGLAGSGGDMTPLAEELAAECCLEPGAASALLDAVSRQRDTAGLPTDRHVVVEAFTDEVGDWRIAVHSVFGYRLNLAWGMALVARLRERHGLDLEWVPHDDGILMRFPALDTNPPADLLRLVTSDRVRELVTSNLSDTALFASRFRENAQRSFLLPRNRPGRRTPLWLQRLRAADLMTLVGRDPDFPIVLETYRQCLEDELDIGHLESLLREIERGDVTVSYVTQDVPSPFTSGILWRFVSSYLYQGDVPAAEARAATLSLNREMLTSLLGGDQMRKLLDPEAVAEVTSQTERTAPGWKAGDAEAVHDLMRRFGDLSTEELRARCEDGVDLGEVLDALGRRVREVGGRWVAADDADAYVAALRPLGGGAAGRSGTGDVEAVESWLRRVVLGRGIVTVRWLAERYGWDASSVRSCLERLAESGLVVHGEFLPSGEDGGGTVGEEWVGAMTLQRMHQRSLALARRRTRPVDGAALARHLLRHQMGSGDTRPSGPEGLDRVLAMLEGVPMYVSLVETDILPSRMRDWHPSMLDAALATGRWAWLMLDARRIVFVRPDRAGWPAIQGDAADASPEAEAIVGLLGAGGGWRTDEIAERLGLAPAKVREELIWLASRGVVSNDSFAPLRHGGSPGGSQGAPVRRRGRGAAASRVWAAGGEGRWSAVRRGDIPEHPDRAAADAVADLLLDRYGVVSREVWASEAWSVPWSDVAGSLDRAEILGDVRRGYFVEGLSGLQYAAVWAIEDLRREPDAGATPVCLASADPANPWGSLLDAHGVRRSSGALVVLENGAPVLSYEGSRVVPLSDRPTAAFEAALGSLRAKLSEKPRVRRRPRVDHWASDPITSRKDVVRVLRAAGWARTPKGFTP